MLSDLNQQNILTTEDTLEELKGEFLKKETKLQFYLQDLALELNQLIHLMGLSKEAFSPMSVYYDTRR